MRKRTISVPGEKLVPIKVVVPESTYRMITEVELANTGGEGVSAWVRFLINKKLGIRNPRTAQ